LAAFFRRRSSWLLGPAGWWLSSPVDSGGSNSYLLGGALWIGSLIGLLAVFSAVIAASLYFSFVALAFATAGIN